ncbi:hypothetical protein PghCCS26_13110 [Paenibacillus glycanilyticus]|uniref:Uncharacterized protein n=1 Tax=Paenibacillus glycanilyticus TaxID=126569 RepID=A0ABQ6NHG0_9BACL|nr:hypothetical protein [Paenibacillus glycanilyticus]GMK44184.1 hypothetical protein PghCCS26_13110 [Paenibacillus glycanilyticus]
MKSWYKKFILVAFSLMLVLPLSVNAAGAAEKPTLTAEQISERLSEIGNSYEVGQLLSDEDAEFVKTYALKPASTGAIAPLSAKTGNFEGGLGYVELTGTVTVDLGIINNSISGNLMVRDSGQTYHKSMGSTAELRCFGVFGEGGTGIGLVYSKDYSNSGANVNYNKNVFSDGFTASVAYYTVDVRGLVDGNSFTATAN